MKPEHPKAGDSVVFTGICELEGVLEDDPNWKDDWFTPNQREAMKNLGI